MFAITIYLSPCKRVWTFWKKLYGWERDAALDIEAAITYNNRAMNNSKSVNVTLKVFTGILLAISLVLTFTVSDYYIFDKFTEYNPLFIICQWIKKAGLLLLPLAAFFKKKSCADIAKYLLPAFVIISLFTYGDFFDITMLTDAASPAEKVYAHINEFIPKYLHMILFFVESEFMLAACAMLFVRDGFKAEWKSFRFLPVAVTAVMPLNIFENFYNENLFDNLSPEFVGDSFLLFKSFTVWHLLAVLILIAFTVGCYYFLRKKSKEKQNDYLAAMAVILLIQYHSKDSVVMGDGYNVYNTVFACIPLFICNIGVYVACLSVFLRKKTLYAISFFVHAAGAITVFLYFGDSISNYGIFCGYSIMYFCLTHCLLFTLSVMPSALGHYKFKPKDAIIPLIYYCIVIVVAAVASALVTSASMTFSYDGYTLREYVKGSMQPNETEWIYPNYAFTQKNPTPIPEPVLNVRIWKCDMNIAYIIILYAVYVGLFYAMNGAYYAFLAIRKRILGRRAPAPQPAYQAPAEAEAEAAVADGAETEKEDSLLSE